MNKPNPLRQQPASARAKDGEVMAEQTLSRDGAQLLEKPAPDSSSFRPDHGGRFAVLFSGLEESHSSRHALPGGPTRSLTSGIGDRRGGPSRIRSESPVRPSSVAGGDAPMGHRAPSSTASLHYPSSHSQAHAAVQEGATGDGFAALRRGNSGDGLSLRSSRAARFLAAGGDISDAAIEAAAAAIHRDALNSRQQVRSRANSEGYEGSVHGSTGLSVSVLDADGIEVALTAALQSATEQELLVPDALPSRLNRSASRGQIGAAQASTTQPQADFGDVSSGLHLHARSRSGSSPARPSHLAAAAAASGVYTSASLSAFGSPGRPGLTIGARSSTGTSVIAGRDTLSPRSPAISRPPSSVSLASLAGAGPSGAGSSGPGTPEVARYDGVASSAHVSGGVLYGDTEEDDLAGYDEPSAADFEAHAASGAAVRPGSTKSPHTGFTYSSPRSRGRTVSRDSLSHEEGIAEVESEDEGYTRRHEPSSLRGRDQQGQQEQGASGSSHLSTSGSVQQGSVAGLRVGLPPHKSSDASSLHSIDEFIGRQDSGAASSLLSSLCGGGGGEVTSAGREGGLGESLETMAKHTRDRRLRHAPKERVPLESLGSKDPRWVLAGKASACAHCGVRFSLLSRKHHCRGCGVVLCADCTPYQAADMRRICKKCNSLRQGRVLRAADVAQDVMHWLDCVAAGDLLEVETRLGLGADVNASEPTEGLTALHVASAYRSYAHHRVHVAQGMLDMLHGEQGAQLRQAAALLPPGPLKKAALGELALLQPGPGTDAGTSGSASSGEGSGSHSDALHARTPSAAEVYTHHIILQAASNAAHAALAAQAAAGLHAAASGSSVAESLHTPVRPGHPTPNPAGHGSWGGLGKMLSVGRKSSVDSIAAMLGHAAVSSGAAVHVEGALESEGQSWEGTSATAGSASASGGPLSVGSAGRSSPVHSFVASPQPSTMAGAPSQAPTALSPLLTSLGSSIGHLVSAAASAAAGKLSGLHLGEKAIGMVASAAGAVVASAGGMDNSDYSILNLAGGETSGGKHHHHSVEGGRQSSHTGGEGSSASDSSVFASPKAQRSSAHAKGSPGSSHAASGVAEATTAVDKMAVALVGLLLREGACVNAVTVSGRTPLHMAVLHGSIGIVQLLLDAGALQGYPDKNGLTPHDYASIRASRGDEEGSHLLGVLDARYSTGLVAAHAQLRKAVAAGTNSAGGVQPRKSSSMSASSPLSPSPSDSDQGGPAHPTTPIPSASTSSPVSAGQGVAKLTPAATNGGNGFISPKMDYQRTSGVSAAHQVQQAQAVAAQLQVQPPTVPQPPVATEGEAEDASHPTSAGVTSNAVTEVLHAAGTVSRAEALPLPGPSEMISAGVHILDPAAAALQANLLAVRNWQHRRLQEIAWLDSFAFADSSSPASVRASDALLPAGGAGAGAEGGRTAARAAEPSVRARAASLGLLAQPHAPSLQDLTRGNELHTWSLVSQVWQAGHPSAASAALSGSGGVAMDGDLTPVVEAAFQRKLGSAYTAPVGLQAMVQQMVGGQQRAGQLSSAPQPPPAVPGPAHSPGLGLVPHLALGGQQASGDAAAAAAYAEEGGPSPLVAATAPVPRARGSSTAEPEPVVRALDDSLTDSLAAGHGTTGSAADESGVIRRTKFSRVVPINPEQPGFSIAAALAADAAAHCGTQPGSGIQGTDGGGQPQQDMGADAAADTRLDSQDGAGQPAVHVDKEQQSHLPGLACSGLTNHGGACTRPATSESVPYCHVHAAQQLLRCDVVVKVPPAWSEKEMQAHMEQVHSAKLLHVVFLPTCAPVHVPDEDGHGAGSGSSQACCTAGPRVCGLVFDRSVHSTSVVPQLVGRLITGSAVHASLWTLGAKPTLEVPLFERVNPHAGLTTTYCNCTEASCECDGGACKCAAAAVLRGQQANAAEAESRAQSGVLGGGGELGGTADGRPTGLRLNLQRTSSEGSLTNAAFSQLGTSAAGAPACLSIRARTQSAEQPPVRGLAGLLGVPDGPEQAHGQGSSSSASGPGMRSSTSGLRLGANPEDSAYEKALLLQMEVEREHEEVFGQPMATLAAVITSSGSMANLAGAVPSAGSDVHSGVSHAVADAPVEGGTSVSAVVPAPPPHGEALEILPNLPVPMPMAGFLQPLRRNSKDKGSKDSLPEGPSSARGPAAHVSSRPPLDASTVGAEYAHAHAHAQQGGLRIPSADFYIGASSNSPNNNNSFAAVALGNPSGAAAEHQHPFPLGIAVSTLSAFMQPMATHSPGGGVPATLAFTGVPGSGMTSASVTPSSGTPPLKSCLKRGGLGASTDNLLLSASAPMPSAIAAGATGTVMSFVGNAGSDMIALAAGHGAPALQVQAGQGSGEGPSAGGRQERTSSVASYFGVNAVPAGADSRTSSFSGPGDADASMLSLSSVSTTGGSTVSSSVMAPGPTASGAASAGPLTGPAAAATGASVPMPAQHEEASSAVDVTAVYGLRSSPDASEWSLPARTLAQAQASGTPPLASQSTSSVYGGPNAIPALPLESRGRASSALSARFRRSVSFADVHEGARRESADYSATGVPISSGQAANAAAAETAALLALASAVAPCCVPAASVSNASSTHLDVLNTVPEGDRETPVPTPTPTGAGTGTEKASAVDTTSSIRDRAAGTLDPFPLASAGERGGSSGTVSGLGLVDAGAAGREGTGSFASVGLRLSASEPESGSQAQRLGLQAFGALRKVGTYEPVPYPAAAPTTHAPRGPGLGAVVAGLGRPARRRGGSPVHLARTAKAGEDSMSDDDDDDEEGEEEEDGDAPSLGRIGAPPASGPRVSASRGQYSQYALKHRAAATARPLGIGRKGGRAVGGTSDDSDLDGDNGGRLRGGQEEDDEEEEEDDDGSVMSRPTASSLSQSSHTSHSRSHSHVPSLAHQPVPDLRVLAANRSPRRTMSLGTPGGTIAAAASPAVASSSGGQLVSGSHTHVNFSGQSPYTLAQPLSQSNSRESSLTGGEGSQARTLSIGVGGASPMTSPLSSLSPGRDAIQGLPPPPPALLRVSATAVPVPAAAVAPQRAETIPSSRQDSLGGLSATSSLRISPPSSSPDSAEVVPNIALGPAPTGQAQAAPTLQVGSVSEARRSSNSYSGPPTGGVHSPHQHQQTVHMLLLQQHPGGLAATGQAAGNGARSGTPPAMTGGLRLSLRRTTSLHSEASEDRGGSTRSLSTAGSGATVSLGMGLRIAKPTTEAADASVAPEVKEEKGVHVGLSLGLGSRHRVSALGRRRAMRTGGAGAGRHSRGEDEDGEGEGSDGSGGSSSEGGTGTRYTRSSGAGSSSISSFGTFGTSSAGNSSGSDSEEGATAAPKARSGQGCTPLIRPLSKEQLNNLMTRSASFQGRMAPVPSLIPSGSGPNSSSTGSTHPQP